MAKQYSVFEVQRRDELGKWYRQLDDVKKQGRNSLIEESNNAEVQEK